MPPMLILLPLLHPILTPSRNGSRAILPRSRASSRSSRATSTLKATIAFVRPRPHSSPTPPLTLFAHTQSQWNKRKQTKEEHKRAKKAKLDPDSATTAAEFRQKRQRADEDGSEGGNSGDEQDEHSGDESAAEEQVPITKKAKKEKKAKSAPPKKKAVAAAAASTDAADTPAKLPAQKKGKGKPSATAVAPESEEVTAAPATKEDSDEEMVDANGPIQINGFSELGDQSTPSESTSTTTTTTPAATPSLKPAKPELDPVARAEQRARLAARIETLRATRKADNIDGSSARTRQELMEARRKKEAQRKERKKAVRLASKLSTEEDGEAAPLTDPALNVAPKVNPVTLVKNFSFGRVMFDDGNQLDASLTAFKREKRRTGPSDILGQLKHTEAKKRRIDNMSDEKKEVVVEKEKWSKALKQTTGEKVKDDEKLLKKALKRQEATKRKSSAEWYEIPHQIPCRSVY